MPIPTTRDELLEGVSHSFAKLSEQLEAAGPRAGKIACVDEWTIKDLLAVRAWWSEAVVEWIEAGRRGEHPTTPAPGYRWMDTPTLNAKLVSEATTTPYRAVRQRLVAAHDQVQATIATLSDRELLEVAMFPWAGKHPLSRWISINTTRQYTTARALVRKALADKTPPPA